MAVWFVWVAQMVRAPGPGGNFWPHYLLVFKCHIMDFLFWNWLQCCAEGPGSELAHVHIIETELIYIVISCKQLVSCCKYNEVTAKCEILPTCEEGLMSRSRISCNNYPLSLAPCQVTFLWFLLSKQVSFSNCSKLSLINEFYVKKWPESTLDQEYCLFPNTRARWKVLGLAYNRRHTQDKRPLM